jgi:S-adenosylmethionine/arginine decarboxylase-like enzyme
MGEMTSRFALKEDTIPWGLLTSLDIYGCNPEIIREADKIRQYVIELCHLIGMRRFGDCQVVHFGNDERVEGHSMVQFIETSLISGHFANFTNAAYLDIFSCKAYDPEQVARFSKEFFQAESVEMHLTKRM